MLRLTIGGTEHYNQETNEFLVVGALTIELEHSLVSVSKWESKFEKPFLVTTARTTEETLAYIEAMLISPVDFSLVESLLTSADFNKIQEYINSGQTATTFGFAPEVKGRPEVVTSELIYYWMVAFNIPFECETWHLNRLFTLIRVCNVKNSKPKKMNRKEIAERNRQLNEQRKAQLGTRG